MKKNRIAVGLGLLIALLAVVVGTQSGLFCQEVKASCDQDQIAQQGEQFTPQYRTFSQSEFDTLISQGKTIVLYFHAGWCTTCTDFHQEMLDSSDTLPDDVVVLQIPYDSSVDLRRQYQVVTQHTLVLLKTDGSIKEMWIGGDLESLLEYLQ